MNPDTTELGFDQATLRLAVPSKGRLSETTVELLRRAGLVFRRRERCLYASCRDTRAGIVFAHAADVPVLVAEGVVDLGVTGSDLVRDRGFDLVTHLALGYGRCRLTVAVRQDSAYQRPADLAGRAIGTKYPNLARDFFRGHGVEVHLIELAGALEVMVSLGLVDAIVEVTESGDTLAENRLRPIASVLDSEAVLVGRARTADDELRDRIVRRIEGVVQAVQYSMLEYNCPVSRLDEAKRITPGFHSPTLQPLADPAWVAVKVMVKKVDVAGVMDSLEALGATAILETEVKNCRL
ncbi:MAG: ATP phosphoribosyltransferase [Planctomycetes bacterium]|nr:ATP phosphoribosyltransferase [Planctomycetota bacterium]